MIIFIILFGAIGIVGFTIFHMLSKAYAKSDEYGAASMAKRFNRDKIIVAVVFIALILLILVLGGIRIIDSTEMGVVKTFGQISHTIDGGLNFVNPISDTVSVYDLKVHVKEAAFASYTKDAQPITATIEYQYALDPAYVMQVAQEYGSYEILESKLCNVAEERAKIVFSKYSAMPLLENRANLSTEVTEEMKELQNLFHVTFTSVVVKDIDFSDAFEASVEAKMTAEQDALRAEQEKRTAVIKAEQAAEVAAIEAQKKVVEAQAEADALAITREALQNMPENWISQMWIEHWDGKLPTYITGNSSNLMITPNID